jgi:hypothetical protein
MGRKPYHLPDLQRIMLNPLDKVIRAVLVKISLEKLESSSSPSISYCIMTVGKNYVTNKASFEAGGMAYKDI